MYSTAPAHLGCAGGSRSCPANSFLPLNLKPSSIPSSIPSSPWQILHTWSSPDVLQRFITFPISPCSCACKISSCAPNYRQMHFLSGQLSWLAAYAAFPHISPLLPLPSSLCFLVSSWDGLFSAWRPYFHST